ncbi:MAG: sulfatase-like hydrolase/transferase [Labilithrix sp.]
MRARRTGGHLFVLAGLVGTVLQADRSIGVWGGLRWAALLTTVAAAVGRGLAALRAPEPAAGIAAATLVLLYAFVDFLDVRLLGQHIDRPQFLAALSAVRTGSVRVGLLDVGVLVGALAVVVAVLYGVDRLVRRLQRSSLVASWLRFARPVRAAAAVLVAIALVIVFTRDVTLTKDSSPWFWHAQAPVVSPGPLEESPFRIGADLVAAEADALRALAQPNALEVSAAQKKSILFVHVESLRADMLNEKNMPKTTAWTARAWSAPHHYSTGNNTVGGFFGAITGLYAAYYPATRKLGFGALPLQVLAKLGYERHIWFPNEALLLDDMVEKIAGAHASAHAIRAPVRADADRDTVRAYLDAVKASTGPRFDYLALDSTHYEYTYPPSFERFTPVSTYGVVVENGVLTQKLSHDEWQTMRKTKGAGVLNAYQNSVLWIDSLLDQLLGELDRSGRLGDTVVAIFGDHGEEFWEHGSWGHSTRFDEEQVRTPLLLFPRPEQPIRYTYSSHADLLPTVFAMLGVRANRPFFNGKSLIDYDAARDNVLLRTAVGGVGDDQRNAIVLDGLKLVYFDGAEPKVIAVRHANDDEWPSPPKALVSRAMGAAVAAKQLH